MVVIGSFTAVGGQPRQQAAMLTLGSTGARASAWYSNRLNEDCTAVLQFYTRDVDWTPDGSGFVIVTTGAGYPGTIKLCDTASRWRNVDAAGQEPQWVNYTGGDTLHSVLVTDKAVFVSGHQRWIDPLGKDTKGAGAVDRQGIGAIDPTTGRATSWNPGKSTEGGLGGFDLYLHQPGAVNGALRAPARHRPGHRSGDARRSRAAALLRAASVGPVGGCADQLSRGSRAAPASARGGVASTWSWTRSAGCARG